jgi:hypothetical protein
VAAMPTWSERAGSFSASPGIRCDVPAGVGRGPCSSGGLGPSLNVSERSAPKG